MVDVIRHGVSKRCVITAMVLALGLATAHEASAQGAPAPESPSSASGSAAAPSANESADESTAPSPAAAIAPSSATSAAPPSASTTTSEASPPALADKKVESPKGYKEQRHTGFYMRADLGLGHIGSSASVPRNQMSISGVDGTFSLAVGGAVVENLILAGEGWTATATGPKLERNGATVTADNDVSSSLAGIGPSVTYYIMPANIYATVTPSLGRLVLHDRTSSVGGATSLGFAGRFALGKEWWVAKHIGVGFAGNFHVAANQDETRAEGRRTSFYWTTFGASLAFSATYN